MPYIYRSPLRPFDIGWAQRANEAAGLPRPELDWDDFEPGEWSPAKAYPLTERLDARFVSQWSLEEDEAQG